MAHTNLLKELAGLPITADSRQVKPGMVFFALSGTVLDGARFIDEALKRGAAAIVCETSPSHKHDIPVFIVQDARLALAQAAADYYQHPSRKLFTVGITGTNGKTTISYLLEKMWGIEQTGVIGTVNIRSCSKVITEAAQTTPDPVSMQKYLADMVSDGATAVAVEVSSHALSQKRCHAIDFDIGIFTNLTQDHLDYHTSMEDYFCSKQKLFNEILPASQKKAKLAIINCDDTYGRLLADQTKIPVKTFSLVDKTASAYAEIISTGIAGTRARLFVDGQFAGDFFTPLIGRHNMQNLLAALLVGQHGGLTADTALTRIAAASVPGRLQRVSGKKHDNFFVDYAHTPDALENVLNTLRDILTPGGRIICVFGCGGDRDPGKRPLMGKIAGRLADIVIITSDNPRTEDPQNIINMILPGVTDQAFAFDGSKGYLVITDRKKALSKAVELAKKDDAVLVAGKGHEDYQIIGSTKHPFDDAKIIKDFLDH